MNGRKTSVATGKDDGIKMDRSLEYADDLIKRLKQTNPKNCFADWNAIALIIIRAYCEGQKDATKRESPVPPDEVA